MSCPAVCASGPSGPSRHAPIPDAGCAQATLWAPAQALHHAGAIAFDDGVCAIDQLQHFFFVLRVFEGRPQLSAGAVQDATGNRLPERCPGRGPCLCRPCGRANYVCAHVRQWRSKRAWADAARSVNEAFGEATLGDSPWVRWRCGSISVSSRASVCGACSVDVAEALACAFAVRPR